jgi:transcription-repair coupling factor (superfamily II helicase)
MGEINLTPETIEHFRKGYREYFGPPDPKDPLYLAISEGRPYAGYEHWLPLFYESLVTLLSYTTGALYCLDDHLDDAQKAYAEQIKDHYETRLQFQSLEKQGIPYHPLPPQRLYSIGEGWESLIPSSHKIKFTSFSQPGGIDTGGKIAPSFASKHTPRDNVFEIVKDTLQAAHNKGGHTLVVGVTQGSAERLSHILKEHHFPPLRLVQTFSEVFT